MAVDDILKMLQGVYKISTELKGILNGSPEGKAQLLLSKLQQRQRLMERIQELVDNRPDSIRREEIADLIESILSLDKANREGIMKIREEVADELGRIYASRRAIKGYRSSPFPEARFVDVVSGTQYGQS